MTRSWWGWGTDEHAVAGTELEALTARISTLLPDSDLTDHAPPDPSALGLPPARIAAPSTLAVLASDAATDRAAHAHGKAFRDVVRDLHGRPRATCPTSSPVRATNSDVVDVLDWCARDGHGGRSRTAAALGGRRRRDRARRPGGDVARPRPAGPRARGRPGRAGRAHPGRRARAAASRTSCARTGSRCGTSRSRSSSPRSAAGWPPAPAGTSPRSTRTSTTWSSRCAWSRRPGSASRGACRARARARHPTACSSARRARSASSPRRGCGCRTRPRWRASAAVHFDSFPAAVERHARRSPSPGSTRRTAGCSTPAEAFLNAGVGDGRQGCSSSASSRPTIRWTPLAGRAPSSIAATTAGRRRTASSSRGRTARPSGRARPTTGARRSCACRTSATPSPAGR